MAKNMKAMKGKKAQKAAMRGMGNQQRVMKKPKGQEELPINESPSNEKWDKLGYTMFGGLLLMAIIMVAGGIYYSTSGFMTAVSANPIDWVGCTIMTLMLAVSILAGRALVNMAFYGTVMLSAKFGGWKASESIAQFATKYKFLNGSGWASTSLVQSLISRGKFDEAIEIAEAEWERSGGNEKQLQNLGPLCAACSMAYQVTGNRKKIAVWSERAIESLTKMLELAEGNNRGLVGHVKMQLAVAHFSNAQFHMEANDYRRAKGSFKNACDYANQSPDFPQKDDIMKLGKEQLQRLKHH